LNDDSLDELFTKLPVHCIFLLEDFDAVNAAHSRQHGAEPIVQEATGSSSRENQKGKVSLSAILNTIDGVGSQEGRLLIRQRTMWSNLMLR
jgi:chaperone BCS1